jgi:tetratricopeptide (TPR) repeat protein
MSGSNLVCTVAAIAAFSAVIASQTPSGHALFEQALAQERVEGNLEEAIRLYERVVAEFASDRALAARALMQVGLSYEKLGREEAVSAYERLVRDFADQDDAVSQARARLAVLTREAPAAVAMPVANPARRLFVDWIDWNRRTGVGYARPTADGRHLVRYNEEQRAFELVDAGTRQTRS